MVVVVVIVHYKPRQAHHLGLMLTTLSFRTESAPCGLRGCKNRPALFPGRMSYKATKPVLVCLSHLSMLYTTQYHTVLWFISALAVFSRNALYKSTFYLLTYFIRAPFYVVLVFVAVCSVFWLF